MFSVMPHRLLSLIVIFAAFQGSISHADSGFVIKNSVLVLGDSLSSALGIEPDQGWVSQLKHRLSSPYFGLKVVNASISGETTQGGLNRIGGLLDQYTPLIVILELGGNDGLRGLPLSLMKDNLDRMIKLALDRKVKVVLIGMKIPTNYGKYYTKQFANIYVSLAAKHNIPLVPFLLADIANHPEMMQDDGIHPRANAQRQMLDNVWPSLKKALPKPHLSRHEQRQFLAIAART